MHHFPSPRPEYRYPLPIHPVDTKMPNQTADALGMAPDEVLILHTSLVPMRLKIQIRFPPRRTKKTVCAAVAMDMPLRHVVKQLLPEDWSVRDASVYVKFRGGMWQEARAGVRVSELVEIGSLAGRIASREVEVKIVVGSENFIGFRERRVNVRDRGLEREMDMEERFWRIG